MNSTPRALNRLLLGLFGLLLMAAGGLGAAVAVSPPAARAWRSMAAAAGEGIETALQRTPAADQRGSWMWLALAAGFLLAAVLMVAWITAQGRGRTGIFVNDNDGAAGGNGGVPGSVSITAGAAEQALRGALLERGELANASVSTWQFRGSPALWVRVFPRKGVAPYKVADDVSRLVAALDLVLGRRTPVLISISTGARARFKRADRVD